MLAFEGIDGGGVGARIVDTLEHVVQKRRPTTAAELVRAAKGGDWIGPKRVLHAFGKGLIRYGVERIQVQDHMGKMLDGAIAHVVAWSATCQGCRLVALKRRDLGRPAATGLLVGEAHPHRRTIADAG